MLGLSTFQLLMLAAGGLLLLYNVDWTAVKNFLGKKTQPALEKTGEKVIIDLEVKEPVRSISAVVKEWEDLRNLCVREGLTTTVKKLDDTFPSFLDLTKDKEVKNV